MASKPKMKVEQFIPLYMAAHKAGMTKEEFAKKIGVEPVTVYQRVYELNRAGLGLPILGAQPKMSLIERAKAAMEAATSGETKTKPKTKTPRIPQVEAAPPVTEEEVQEEPEVEAAVNEEVEEEDELEKLLGG
jgi:hypothetical protein